MSDSKRNDNVDERSDLGTATNMRTSGLLGRIDRWMAANPWHPRVAPFLTYIVLLPVIRYATDYLPQSSPVLYSIQYILVGAMLWRYRKLTPELTIRFHWLAIPVGVGVFVAWIGLGMAMIGLWPGFAQRNLPFWHETNMGPVVGHIAFGLRLAGMAVLVPLFEELFIRSLILRSLHRPRETGIGLIQILEDLPLIGEWILHTKLARRMANQPLMFTREFNRTPFGVLSVFGVIASTFVFMLSHFPRDWPGIWVCGVAYCLLLAATRHKGLGPVVWAHGITNALLWVYTLNTGNWQFL